MHGSGELKGCYPVWWVTSPGNYSLRLEFCWLMRPCYENSPGDPLYLCWHLAVGSSESRYHAERVLQCDIASVWFMPLKEGTPNAISCPAPHGTDPQVHRALSATPPTPCINTANGLPSLRILYRYMVCYIDVHVPFRPHPRSIVMAGSWCIVPKLIKHTRSYRLLSINIPPDCWPSPRKNDSVQRAICGAGRL